MTHDSDAASGGSPAFPETPSLFDLVDREEALERACGDEEFLGELLRIFRDDAPAMLQRLDAAGANAGGHELERAAHSLKGASATISARAVSALAADVERLARESRPAEAQARLPELRREFSRLMRALDASLGRKAA